MRLRLKVPDFSVAILCLLYKLFLDFYYMNYISPRWSYIGLVSDFTLSKTIASYIITAILFCLLNWDKDKIGNVILQYLFIIMIIPLLSFYGLANKQTEFLLFCVLGFMITVMMVNIFSGSRLNLKLRDFIYVKNLFVYATVMLIFTVAYMINVYGLHFNAADMLDSAVVSSIRASQSSIRAGGYLISWSYKVICPLLISLSLSENNKRKVVFYCCLQMIMYFCTPHKEIVLSMFLIFCTFYAYKKNILKYFWFCLLTGLIAIGIVFEELLYERFSLIVEAIVYRLLFIPASIKFEHYTFFSQREKLFFSEGLIGRLFGNEYKYGTQSVGQVISNYFYNTDSNSNTGYLAYSYDDIGFLGIIIASVLLALLIVFLQSILTEKNILFILPASLYTFGQLNDGPLLTAMLTGGILVLLFVVVIVELKPKT